MEIAAKGQMKIRKNYNNTYDESGGNIYFNSLRNLVESLIKNKKDSFDKAPSNILITQIELLNIS